MADKDLIELPLAARAILEAAPDAMVVTDRLGRIVMASTEAERVFGYEPGELHGQLVEILVPERFRRRHPSQRNRYFVAPRSRAMGSGGIDLWARRKDGSEFPAEIGLSPLETEDGMLAITSVRDVSLRRRHETMFRGLLEAAPDAMVISDPADKIVLVNAQAERLFGYPRAELLGEKIDALVPKSLRGDFAELRRRPASQAEAVSLGDGGLDLCGQRRDGSEFPAEISISPLETEEGLLLITAVRDVSERRRAEEERLRLVQVQEALRVRDEFLAVTAHELRTPLTAMRLQLEGLQHVLRRSSDPLAARLVARLQKALKQGQRLSELVDTLLDVSRIMAGELALQLERTDLDQLVREVAEDFREQAERQQSELVFELEPVNVVCDRFRIEQVLTNLLSNAIKYGAGRPVHLRLRKDGAGARLSVRDEGIGISEGDAERIFERFERAVSFRHYGGIGLGLYISRHLVEAHGGTIAVASRPGEGAEFVVELPAQPAGDAEYASPLAVEDTRDKAL